MGRLVDSSLGSTYLGMSPSLAVAAPAYLKTRGVPARPDALRAHNVLIYSTAQGDAIWHFTGPKENSQAIAVKGRLRSNNLSVLPGAAREGLGAAVLPHYVASDGLRSGEILSILEEWQLPGQEVHALYPSPRMVPAKVQTLIAWLGGAVRGQPVARRCSGPAGGGSRAQMVNKKSSFQPSLPRARTLVTLGTAMQSGCSNVNGASPVL